MAKIRIKRGTRAQLNAAKTAGTLAAGEPYLVTDQGVVAVGTGTGDYIDVGPGVQSVVAGSGVSVDSTDPQHPVVSASGSGAALYTIQNVCTMRAY